jgi:hypothetical protein
MMKIRKTRIVTMVSAVIALAIASSAAQASPWSMTYSGYFGGVSSAPSGNGVGGIFDTTLYKNNVAVTRWSVCNDLGQYIPPINVTDVKSLQDVTAADVAAGWYTTDKNAVHFDGGITSGPDNRAGIAYLIATYLQPAAAAHDVTTAKALQYEVWKLWGFNVYWSNLSASEQALATTMAGQAADAITNNYYNASVWWVHSDDNQDQIVITPEASSLALLLPGLLPVALVLRKRAKRA